MNDFLLAGSYAYDTILLHEGEFHSKILPESIARLNVSFGIDSVKDEFGGTAGNIAYNSALLKLKPLLIGSLGNDSAPYIRHLEWLGLDTDTLTVVDDRKTAHAWVMTDNENNQITGFNAGAMKIKPHLPAITPHLWHLSPDSPLTTAWLAHEAVQAGKEYYFDPGQALPSFLAGVADSILPLEALIGHAKGIFVNDYEGELLEAKLGVKLQAMVKGNQFIVRTLGGKGVELIRETHTVSFPVAKVNQIVDPTGCGDAFRAGFLYGIKEQYSLEDSVKMGAVMGSFAIECSGGQNHKPKMNEIQERFKQSFSEKKLKP